MALQERKTKKIIHLSSLHITTKHHFIWFPTCTRNPKACLQLNTSRKAGNPGKLSTHPRGMENPPPPLEFISGAPRQHSKRVSYCSSTCCFGTGPASPLSGRSRRLRTLSLLLMKISHTDHVTYIPFDKLIRFCSFCPSCQMFSSVP